MCEVIFVIDIVVVDGCIVYVGFDVVFCIGFDMQVIDVGGCFMLFGLIDVYMYVEFGMLIFVGFVVVVILYGIMMIFYDLYEIVNVMGFEGVRLMCDELLL